MTKAAILIPYRKGDRHRELAFEFVYAWYSKLGDVPVVVGEDNEPGHFNRSRAINRAAWLAPKDTDVYVVVDADTFVDLDQVRAAIDTADVTHRLVHAFTTWRGISEAGSRQVYGGRDPETWSAIARRQMAREVYYDSAVSSCLAVHMALWSKVEGFDAGFRGWGYEDQAFWMACSTLGGLSLRVNGSAWHLYHPVARERTAAISKGSPNRGLRDRYAEANGKYAAMYDLIAQRHLPPRNPTTTNGARL